jgi:hypothetical protein
MKRGTHQHPKMEDLAARLDRELPLAVGILNILWDFAATFTPRGDIGKYSDEILSRKLDWRGDPGKLIEALIASGWLDRDERHRLLIHDWPTHCEDSVHAKLARERLYFANGQTPRFPKLDAKEKKAATAFYAAASGSQRQPESAVGSLPCLSPSLPDHTHTPPSELVCDPNSDPPPEPPPGKESPPPQVQNAAEPETKSATPGRSPGLVLAFKQRGAMDVSLEGFDEAWEKYLRLTGKPFVPDVDGPRDRFKWKTLDFEQKHKAASYIEEYVSRNTRSDPTFWPSFAGYLEKKPWDAISIRQPPRSAANGGYVFDIPELG